jgi:hypothetical protein
MSNNFYFTIKAIKENKTGATTEQIAKYGVKNVSATVAKLRARGHEIVTEFFVTDGVRKGRYILPFGTRDEAAKLTKTARKQIAKQFGLV